MTMTSKDFIEFINNRYETVKAVAYDENYRKLYIKSESSENISNVAEEVSNIIKTNATLLTVDLLHGDIVMNMDFASTSSTIVQQYYHKVFVQVLTPEILSCKQEEIKKETAKFIAEEERLSQLSNTK